MNSVNSPSVPGAKPTVIWRILDGKAGHEAQSLGLLNALEQRISIACHELAAPTKWNSIWGFILKQFDAGSALPSPDLIIGAGSKTHLALLAARRSYGGKAIVLMRPTLPASLFDLCLIPKHDSKKASKKVVLTDGVLNPIKPADNPDPQRGLFLIGGPSSHYNWNTEAILKQVITLTHETPAVQWILTTSRRTPAECTQQLVNASCPNMEVVPVEQTPRGWVAARLQECKRAWVSEDSVSMVYEALTAGALTGVLEVPAKKTT